MTTIALNRLHFPVNVLGPGRRAGIWFQGCSLGCRGCMSLDTWATRGVERVDVEEVLTWLAGVPAEGVTISGGEPTEQPDALRALLAGLVAWRGDTERDVLVFTGRSPEWSRTDGAELLAGADAVVAGPFVPELAGVTPLRGSDNQELLLLTERAHLAYADLTEFPRSALQLGADAQGLWLIGIPMPGGLDAFDDVEDGDVARRPSVKRRTWR